LQDKGGLRREIGEPIVFVTLGLPEKSRCDADLVRATKPMAAYHIQFWRGEEQIIDFEDDEYLGLVEAGRHIEDLIREMVADSWGEDWIGCSFVVATHNGKAIHRVPVLEAMGAMTRRTRH
jgi:hypothetical protein